MSASSWPMVGQTTGARAGEHHLDYKPIDTSEAVDALRAAATVCQFALQQVPQEVELSQELLVYPEGEGDAVTISERDMEGLQPMRFLSNNIVDFYIRYLERRVSRENGKRFYFFNSFFFTKLLKSTASTGIDPCKVDYEQVRKWSGEANLFEKDYVFIPILKSSHWSLVIICHLGSLTSSPDETTGSPCILHLDPIEGQHERFEGLVRSYVLQAWMERFQASSNMDQLLALCQMKYVQAKVPQQDNEHDCGLYLLNYVEAFLVESTSPDFSFALSERGPHFTSPHFVEEVLAKRRHIQNLILEHSRISQERARKRRAIKNLVQELMRTSEKLEAFLEDEGEYASKDVLNNGPSIFNGEGSEIQHASPDEDAMDAQHQQSTCIARLDDESWAGPEIAGAEYQKISESLSDKQQIVEHEKLPCVVLSEPLKGKNKRGRNWTEEETLVLLMCKGEGGRFCKGRQAGTRWNLISQEIGKKLGTMPSEDQCRLRYDTLLKACKAYKKYCLKTGKSFFEITEEERLELKLATTLSKEWYSTIDEICEKAKSQKRIKPNSNVCNDLRPLSSLDSPPQDPAPISDGSSFHDGSTISESVCRRGEVKLGNVIQPIWFSTLNEDLQCTLLNLVQECLRSWSSKSAEDGGAFCFGLCERLGIVQDREEWEIHKYVFMLWEQKLVNVMGMVFDEGMDLTSIDIWMCKRWFLKLGVFEEISKGVLCNNPQFKTYYNTFPIEQSSLQWIRVLSLDGCEELEHLDLRGLPNLRCLDILACENFDLVTGWECATGLGSLEISDCPLYRDFRPVQYLFSLRDIFLCSLSLSTIPLQLPNFSQCVKLRELVLIFDKNSPENMDLKDLQELKFLEVLEFRCCTFITIQGLSGLQALTTLNLRECYNLRRVSELGCLTGLTVLNLSDSGVEDIRGVEELHLLTELDLQGCLLLKRLPFLGHLRALVHLDLRGTGVEEIPGIEDLISLKALQCGSKMKKLPTLPHLPLLQVEYW